MSRELTDRVRTLDDGRIEVFGPAIVRTPQGGEYEIQTDVSLRFPAGTEVWLKVDPQEAQRA
jgi:hypothetical protein